MKTETSNTQYITTLSKNLHAEHNALKNMINTYEDNPDTDKAILKALWRREKKVMRLIIAVFCQRSQAW